MSIQSMASMGSMGTLVATTGNAVANMSTDTGSVGIPTTAATTYAGPNSTNGINTNLNENEINAAAQIIAKIRVKL